MKAIDRVTERRTVRPLRNGRRIVVAVEPGDVLAMREERTRKWYRIGIEGLYWMVVRIDAEKEHAARRAAKRAARQGGK